MTPLSWSAQVAAHAAYVEARRIVVPPATPRAPVVGKRRSPASGISHRAALLHALGDGRPHRFGDLVAALPGLSRQGIYYLCDQLKAEGRLDWVIANRSNRIYRLT